MIGLGALSLTLAFLLYAAKIELSGVKSTTTRIATARKVSDGSPNPQSTTINQEKLVPAPIAPKKTLSASSAADPAKLAFDRFQRELEQPINYKRIRRQELYYQFGDWISELTISSEAKVKLKKFLEDRAIRSTDAKSAALQLGIKDQSTIDRMIQEETSVVDKEITSIVGEAEYSRFTSLLNIQEGLSLYTMQLKADFAYAELPLKVDQVISLIEAQKQSRALSVDTKVNTNGLRARDSWVLQKSSTFMSQEQVNILRDYYLSRYEVQQATTQSRK